MDRKSAGRLGGLKGGRKGGFVTHQRHGLTRCPTCNSVIPSGWHEVNGSQGGNETLRRYGPGHFSEIGKLGGRGNSKRTVTEATESSLNTEARVAGGSSADVASCEK